MVQISVFTSFFLRLFKLIHSVFTLNVWNSSSVNAMWVAEAIFVIDNNNHLIFIAFWFDIFYDCGIFKFEWKKWDMNLRFMVFWFWAEYLVQRFGYCWIFRNSFLFLTIWILEGWIICWNCLLNDKSCCVKETKKSVTYIWKLPYTYWRNPR